MRHHSTQEGPVLQELEWEELDAGEILLPYHERRKANHAHHDHDDDARALPRVRGRAHQAERESDERESSRDENRPND